MTKTAVLTIKLLSDLCAGTGEAIPGYVDSETAQEYGVPLIPAKRLKGDLRAVALEMQDNGLADSRVVQQLFGAPGQEKSGTLRIYDAHVYMAPVWENGERVKDYPAFLQDLDAQYQRDKNHCAAQVLELFTHLRTQTAIADGVAKDNSLRSMRVVDRGTVFRAGVELDTDPSLNVDQLTDLLRCCVQGLRSIGMGVTRGLGEVYCTIDGWQTVRVKTFSVVCAIDEAQEIEWPYQIILDSPVVQGSGFISGSALQGAFAGMYIAEHGLKQAAHRDADFRRIFLEDGVQFGFAFPAIRDAQGLRTFYPCPRRLKRVKHTDKILDLESHSLEKGKPQTESKAIGFPFENKKIQVYAPHAEMRLHHARAQNRAIGHAVGSERAMQLDVQGAPGELYAYRALSAGQIFIGTLRGKPSDLEKLRDCLQKRGNRLHLGRSRTAEYGNVRLTLLQPERAFKLRTEEQQLKKRGTQVQLWLLTPMLLQDPETGRFEADPAHLQQLLQQSLPYKVKDVQGKYTALTQVGGYNSKWRLPKPQRPAIAAGSVLCVEFTNQELPPASFFEGQRWGAAIGEGYGQVKVLPEADNGGFCREEVQPKQALDKPPCVEVKKLFEKVDFQLEQVELEEKGRIKAQEAAGKGELPNGTTLQRLLAHAEGCEPGKVYGVLQNAVKRVKDEEKKNSVEKLFLSFNEKKGERRDVFIKAYLRQAILCTREVEQYE